MPKKIYQNHNDELKEITLHSIETALALLMKEKDLEEISITDYDDLDYFQNAIIAVDSAGTMLCRNYGEVLYANEPDHLYIGVKDLTEAETIFRRWIAPDVELSTTIPTTSGLTCPLTDANGKPQGTIYFTPGTERKIVAEVTASSDTPLKHFKKITFLLNAAWPLQTSIYRKYTGQKDAQPITMGGATYARAVPNTVAFGPVFPGEVDLCHQPNEYIDIETMVTSTKIFAEALYQLAK